MVQALGKYGHKLVPVLYLDIDGTVRYGYDELGYYVSKASDVTIFPEVPNILKQYKEAGWRIVGISNQGGIALGHQTTKDCIDAMRETYNQSGQFFDKIAWCQHHPQAKEPEMSVCWCRKPRIGLIIEAVSWLGQGRPGEAYPPHMALFVGDRDEDRQCAANANITFMDAKEWRAIVTHPIKL